MALNGADKSSDSVRKLDKKYDHQSHRTSYGTTGGDATRASTASHGVESASPPHDRKGARLFLAGCFWLEFITWGLPFSYGIFEQYYSSHPVFSSESGIAAVGTTCMGAAYFLGPATLLALRRWPSRRKVVSVIGLFMMLFGLILASFATHVIHLVLTQGLLYGVGTALLYNPFIFYMDEWFGNGKGLAYSIFWAGTGISGAVMPFLIEWGLDTYGFETTLRAWAIFSFVCLGFLVYFLGPPETSLKQSVTPNVRYDFLRSPLFWAFQTGNIIEGLGYFVPQIYLRSFAEDAGFSGLVAISSVSVVNLFSTFGLIFIGLLVDRYHISTVLMLSAVTATLSVFLFWGFAVNEIVLLLFSVTFGIFAGGYVATWTGCAVEVQKGLPGSDLAAILGFMAAGRGIGAVLSGPISEALLRVGPLQHAYGAYGTKYGALIVFTGLTSLMGRFGLFGKWGLQAGPAKGKEQHTNASSEESESLLPS